MSSLDFDKTESILGSDVMENDVHVKLQELTNKLKKVEVEKETVESEKQKMKAEYDVQRANYMKLYTKREEEIKRLKDELEEFRIREVEKELHIGDLCQLIQDVESNSSQNRVQALEKALHTLEEQLTKVTSADRSTADSLLMAPSNMLSVTKSFAKKVVMEVSQLGSDSSKNADDLEDSMRKAQEDSERMRSLVLPLEKKIEELQAKLDAKDEVRRGKENESMKLVPESIENIDGISPSRSLACDMCINYEIQLQEQQQVAKKLSKEKQSMQANMDKFKEDLLKANQLRKEMEEKWNEKKEEQKLQVIQLKEELLVGKVEVEELKKAYNATESVVREEIHKLRFDREKVNREMQDLLVENEKLVGKHSKHSEELQNEVINFPDNVTECQELLLATHENLIAALVAKEDKEEQLNSVEYQLQLLQSQIDSEKLAHDGREAALNSDVATLRKHYEMLSAQNAALKTELERKQPRESEYQAEIDSLTDKMHILNDEHKKAQETVMELRSCVASLQEQLNQSEEVQRELVRFSQSLQIELEAIRGADTEVRWQHEADIHECRGCKQAFSSSKNKTHCRHCGKIFCSSCLQHTVDSGPNKRPSKVCEVCHTLLNRDSTPYFGEKAPHSPG